MAVREVEVFDESAGARDHSLPLLTTSIPLVMLLIASGCGHGILWVEEVLVIIALLAMVITLTTIPLLVVTLTSIVLPWQDRLLHIDVVVVPNRVQVEKWAPIV